MNLTNNSILFPFDIGDDDREFSHALAIIQGSIYIPIFCAGIANNLLTILIILLNRDMHTVTNCYLLNLAISDSLPLIVSLPYEITFLSIKLPWGELGCKFRSLFAETSTNASILTISAFTIERYIAVCRPLHTSILTTRRAIKIQILIWFIAILSSTPYFYLTVKFDNHCYFDQDFPLFVKICFYISATFFFVLPAFILCILYALMAQRLYSTDLFHDFRRSKSSGTGSYSSPICVKRVKHDSSGLEESAKQQCDLSTTGTTRYSFIPNSNKNSSATSSSATSQSMKKSAFKMLFAVVIAFIICYAPFHVQRLITSSSNAGQLSLLQRRAITIFYFISGIFYYLGSTINPIFYHLFSRKYREACLRTMKRIIHCRRNDHKHYYKNNNYYFHKTIKSPPVKRLVLYTNLPRSSLNMSNKRKISKTIETNYRLPNKYRTSLDMNRNKQRVLRLSLPTFNTERM